MPKQNISPWNALIKGYPIHGRCEEVLELYCQMQTAAVQPDIFTFPFVLKACAGLAALQQGKGVHDCIIRSGLDTNIWVETALINMYAKCRNLEDASKVFDKMSQRNLVSWTAMIAGYAQNGHAEKALDVFREMQLAGVKPNCVTITSLLPACTALSAALVGKEVHGYLIKSVFDFDVLVTNALVDMYAKCSGIDFARRVFDKMSLRNVNSWNAMIVGYTQDRNCAEDLKLFDQMQEARVHPDSVTWNALISGCAQNGYVNEAFHLIMGMQLAPKNNPAQSFHQKTILL